MNRILEQLHVDRYLIPADEFVAFRDLEQHIFPSPDSQQGKCILEAGEQALAAEIPILRATSYMRFLKDGNRTEYEEPYNRRRFMLVALVAAELVEQKGRFVEKMMDLIWCILEETSWVYPAHNGKRGNLPIWFGREVTGLDLFAAETGANLAMAYYYMKDAILEQGGAILLERLAYEVNRQVLSPYLQEDEQWMGFRGGKINNWNPWISGNTLFCLAVLEKDVGRRAKMVDKICRSLDNYIADLPEDGGCDEGPNYWSLAGGALYDCLEILCDLTGGAVDVFDREDVRRIMEYISKAHICGKYCITYGDSHGKTFLNGIYLWRMGRRIRSRVLEGMGQKLAREQGGVMGLTSGCTPRLYKNLLACASMPRDTQENAVYRAETFVLLPDMQLAALREWPREDKGFYVWMKGGHNNESHNHNDVGNVGIYYNGTPVIVDYGVGVYTRKTFSAERYTLFPMDSCDHNLPLIGGIGQKQGEEYRADFFRADEQSRCICAGLAGAYANREEIVSYTRSVKLEDSPSGSCLVLLQENLALQKAQMVEFRLHLIRKPEYTADGRLRLGENVLLGWEDALEMDVQEIVPEERLQKDWETERFYRLVFRTRGPVEKLQVQFTFGA